MKKEMVITLLLIMLSLNLVLAKPPFQQSTQTTGLILEVPVIEYHKVNTTFEFHVHVHNSTNGRIVDPETIDSCFVHIYQPSDGEHVIEVLTQTLMEPGGLGLDMKYEVLGGNFSEVGQYAILLYCQEGDQGGFFEFPFYVTHTGFDFNTQKAITYIGLLAGALLLFAFLFYWMIKLEFGNFIDDDKKFLGINPYKYVKVFLVPVNYVIIMWIFGLTRSIGANYLDLPGLTLLFNWAYWIMMYLAFPLVIVSLYIMIVLVINDRRIQDALERGDPFDGRYGS